MIELTIGLHDGGLVSTYLHRHARPGMVVGLDGVGGDFVLPDTRPRRILFVAGGSGITPLMSMLRTLKAEKFDGEIAFVHYARSAEEACYRDELAATPGVRVLHGYTRSDEKGDLRGHFDATHLAAAMAVTRRGVRVRAAVIGRRRTRALRQRSAPKASCRRCSSPTLGLGRPNHLQRQRHRPHRRRPAAARPSRVRGSDARKRMPDGHLPHLHAPQDPRRRQEPDHRRGVGHSTDEDVQICVSVPVGDVDLAL